MLTKKKLALSTIIAAVIYFILLMFLPESIVGERRADNLFMFIFKIGFLAMTSAFITSGLLMFVLKRNFVVRQWESFSRFKYLLQLLVKRDFVSRYRKSVLGVLWSLLNPLLTMIIMTMVFSYLFRFDIPNYPLYLLSGNIIFAFFTESTMLAMNSVISAEPIIKKVYVPKYIFPVSRVISSLVNLFFSTIAFLMVFIIMRAPFHWTMLLIPIPIIYTFVFSLGVAMLLSSLAVFFRDLTYLYDVFTKLLIYLTPIFYPISIIPERLVPVFGLNPMYHFASYFRNIALDGIVPGLWENMVCMGFSMAAFCIGVYVFMSKQDRFILYM